MLHNNLALGDRHAAHNWEYASATYGNFSLGWWAGVFTIEDCAATEAAGTGTDTASTFTDSTTPAATAYISEDLYVIS